MDDLPTPAIQHTCIALYNILQHDRPMHFQVCCLIDFSIVVHAIGKIQMSECCLCHASLLELYQYNGYTRNRADYYNNWLLSVSVGIIGTAETEYRHLDK